jgi:hypothetical protein
MFLILDQQDLSIRWIEKYTWNWFVSAVIECKDSRLIQIF